MRLTRHLKDFGRALLCSLTALTLVFAPLGSAFAETYEEHYTDDDPDSPSEQGGLTDAQIEEANNFQAETQAVHDAEFFEAVQLGDPAAPGYRYSQNAGMETGTGQGSYAAAEVGGQFAGCVFGATLGNLISYFITHLIETLLVEKLEAAVRAVLKVPVDASKLNEITAASRSKDVCSLQIWGICILPSLNAVFYCLVNGVIEYIGQATVRWINSGFEGNPVFIDNPSQFFEDAADRVAGDFINGLTDGLLCEPFKVQLQLNLLRGYQRSRAGSYGSPGSANSGACRLTDVAQNAQAFLSGDFAQGGLEGLRVVALDDNSNPKGAQLRAQDALYGNIRYQDNTLKLEANWNQGWLSRKDPETGRTKVPGGTVKAQADQRLFNAEQRLLMADQFDQIIAALVNQLVKVALSELLDATE